MEAEGVALDQQGVTPAAAFAGGHWPAELVWRLCSADHISDQANLAEHGCRSKGHALLCGEGRLDVAGRALGKVSDEPARDEQRWRLVGVGFTRTDLADRDRRRENQTYPPIR
ncbi:MAG: hypothetical protein AMXMBFR61_16540 [Fimbriimonadales bacterium]